MQYYNGKYFIKFELQWKKINKLLLITGYNGKKYPPLSSGHCVWIV